MVESGPDFEKLTEFQKLCALRNVNADDWKRQLKAPLVQEKCLLDMTDEELEEHYRRVEERAENTKEDRALIVLEQEQDGRLERQAKKEFAKYAKEDKIFADEVPQMLENLRFELSNTEVHYLLRKFDATEGFEMLPEVQLNQRSWLWLVGECQMLKASYDHINQEAFEICYETMVQNQKLAKEQGPDSEDWPKPDAALPLKRVAAKATSDKFTHKLSPEEEEDLDKEIAAFKESQGGPKALAQAPYQE